MLGRQFAALVQQLWRDDRGAVTLEYLLLGSIVAAGGVAGLSAMSDAVNDELREFGKSVRQIRQAAPIQMPTQHGPNARVGRVANVQQAGQEVDCVGGSCDFGCP